MQATRAISQEAISTAELILELAGRAGDKALEAQCCAGLAFATFMLGNGLRPDLISRALAGPQQSPRLSMDLRPNVVVGHILHWTDDLDGARVLYEQEYALAVEQGVETGLPFVLWALAENEGWAGNWPRAEQLAAEGYRLAEDSGSPAAIAFMSVARGLMHAYRGRIDAGLRDAARAVELAGELGMPLLAAMAAQAFGIAALSTGDAMGAHERLGPFAEAALAAGVAEPALCRFVPDEIEALTRLGDLGTAEALLGPFEARSAQLGRGWGIAAAGRCRGLLLAARGDLAGAGAALEAGLQAHRRLAMPFEEARTLLAAGEVHRRARHKHRRWNSSRPPWRSSNGSVRRGGKIASWDELGPGGNTRHGAGSRAGPDRRRAAGGRPGRRRPAPTRRSPPGCSWGCAPSKPTCPGCTASSACGPGPNCAGC